MSGPDDDDDDGEDLGAELLADELEDDGFVTVHPGDRRNGWTHHNDWGVND